MTIIIPLLMKEESKDLNILDLMPYMHYFMCETSYLTQKISLNCWHFVFRIVPSSKISMTTIRYIILSVSYKKQELLTLHRHLNSPPIFGWVCIAHLFIFFCVVLLCLYVLRFHVVMSITISTYYTLCCQFL